MKTINSEINNNALRITLTANAGVILQSSERCVLIDALHNGKTLEFSSVSDAEFGQIREMFRERHPDLVLVTHRHPDHCSDEPLRRFAEMWPDTVFLFPEHFPEERLHSRLKDILITSMTLPHDGKGFEDVDQRGYCITLGGKTILHAGDAALSSPEKILTLTEGRKIDAAVMNFPWITLPAGRAFLEEKLKPDHLMIVHLPFEEKDVFGYRKAAYRAVEKTDLPDVRIMDHPMQTEEIV